MLKLLAIKNSQFVSCIIIILIALFIACSKDSSLSPANNSGKGGSMARFTIVNNYMYAVDKSTLKVFDISNPADPIYKSEISNLGGEDIGSNVIETIFAYNNRLFIGSNAGFFIYDITNLQFPVLLSTYEHILSCDPVVVNDTLAFVTLRSNSQCRLGNNQSNQLDIVDIKNILEPKLIKSYAMENPHGLTLHRNYLFLCEAEFGLKIFDFKEVNNLKQCYHFSNVYAYDVIANDGILLLTGSDGIYQYDYTRMDSIFKISNIPITR